MGRFAIINGPRVRREKEGNSMSVSGAEIMVKCLEKQGVKVLFGYPGAAICPFYDALLQSHMHHVLVRQEQNAGHAASGYARTSGEVGVCVVTSGPGATNLITAIASAYMDSIPIVAITGQVRSDLLGRDVFQEADITGACEPFTKHSYLVKRTADLPRIFKEAFHIASTGRPGPVLIDVPVDIQQNRLDKVGYPDKIDILGYKPSVAGHAVQISRAADAIQKAKRPVICAGGGVFSAGAVEALRRLVEQTSIPCVCTMMGIGALPTAHPLNLGMLGTHGLKGANAAIHGADLVVLCGARVGDRAMAAPDQVAAHAKIIHIDIDPAEIGKNMPATIPIVGDLRLVLEKLCETLGVNSVCCPADWCEACQAGRVPYTRHFSTDLVNPKALIRLLSDRLREDSVLVADVGQNQIWSANHYQVKKGRFLTSGGMGTMGYSVPAAIGAKMARPDRQVVAVCGDGSFQMQMMELGTLCQEGLDLKIIVMTNHRLGMVRELQDKGYGGRQSGVNLAGSPDFIGLAAAYGIPSLRITSDGEAPAAVERLLSTDGPFLLECQVDEKEPSL